MMRTILVISALTIIFFALMQQSLLAWTYEVPNDKNLKVTTEDILVWGRWYKFTAEGEVSNWGHLTEGIDAVYCYGPCRPGKLLIWQQLRIGFENDLNENSKGMNDLYGSVLPFDSVDHKYEILIRGEGKKLELWMYDAVDLDSSIDNSGSITVTITPVTRPLYDLSVSVVPRRGGSISSSPWGINCPPQPTCSYNFRHNEQVVLRAEANDGYKFDHWVGDVCDDIMSPTCTVIMDYPMEIWALFKEASPTNFINPIINLTLGGEE